MMVELARSDRQVTAHHTEAVVEPARQRIRRTLALFWLFDGGLQLQPFMFGPQFVQQVFQPAARDQPAPLAALVSAGAHLVGSQVGTWGMLFAGLEIGIGVGLLYQATARPALWASAAWSVVVWIFGEGLGGLLTGHASLLTGAPGAALLYLLLTFLAWPAGGERLPRLRRIAVVAWITIWLGGAALQLLLIGAGRGSLATVLWTASLAAPGFLADVQRALATVPVVASAGGAVAAALMAVIGLLALRRRTRAVSLVAGIVLALVMWALTQSLGGVFTSTATDPGTAPLIAVVGLACWRLDRSSDEEWL